MTGRSLAELNVGENLDTLMNLDPRGYGVCRVLYPATRKFSGEPVAMHTAKKLYEILKDSDPETVVFIQTGFVLLAHEMPETDGITGALLLARALIMAFNITPVLVVNEKNIDAIKMCAPIMGLHVYDSVDKARKTMLSFSYVSISTDEKIAGNQIETLLNTVKPAAVFATEAAGANVEGKYHNAVGVEITRLESKSDSFFSGYQKLGVPCFAVGDLGNEIGMGAISDHIKKFIPKGEEIVSAVAADFLVTATVSDWGVYAVIAAIAYLKNDISIMHDEKMEEDVLRQCCLCGMVDMTGSLLPAIDGFSVEMEKQIVSLMRSTVAYAISYPQNDWFSQVLKKGFYG